MFEKHASRAARRQRRRPRERLDVYSGANAPAVPRKIEAARKPPSLCYLRALTTLSFLSTNVPHYFGCFEP